VVGGVLSGCVHSQPWVWEQAHLEPKLALTRLAHLTDQAALDRSQKVRETNGPADGYW
jgi:hypothetical protein